MGLRRRFSREFKPEAVRPVRERVVAMAQVARDLDVHVIVLRVYPTCDAARTDIFDYLERFYNPTRRHSAA